MITAPWSEKESEPSRKHEASWIVRWLIRAGAEEMLRKGMIGPLPLKVRFMDSSEDIPNWRLGYGGDYSLN